MSNDDTALQIARLAGQLALSKRAFDVKILKLSELSSVCDYFVIASGDADIQVKAIAATIERGLRDKGVRPSHREGEREGNWILLDFMEVVVHIFREQTRQFYALEKLWGDAPTEEITDN
ncbi:MAG: ribosome silencing factor [candidate division Zixibacteria bacterium]